MMRMGVSHRTTEFALKQQIVESLRSLAHEVVDFGVHQLNPRDDYPDSAR